jgi:hypothetical protein
MDVLGWAGLGLTVSGGLIGAVVWAVRIEGRVNTNEKVTAIQLEDIIERLARMERKQDAANGHGKN